MPGMRVSSLPSEMVALELLAPKPDERILNLGCGDGALSAKLVAIKGDVATPKAIGPGGRFAGEFGGLRCVEVKACRF